MTGAAPTTLSSSAYIRKICEEMLPKPMSEYSKVTTPCSPDIMSMYDRAVESRHEVCPRLKQSYPRKCGKIV